MQQQCDIIELDGIESDSIPNTREGEVGISTVELRIERTYHLDVDFQVDTNEGALELAAELATGLLVTWDVVAPAIIGNKRINKIATVRFSGPRAHLQRMVDTVDAERFDPDFATAEDRSPVVHGDLKFEG